MKKFLKPFLCIFLSLLLIVMVAMGIFIGNGILSLRKRSAPPPDLSNGDTWYWQDDRTFIADGIAYTPRKNLFTTLVIGVGSNAERKASGYTNGLGVADAFILAVLDPTSNHLTLLSIPRDTQTTLSWCDKNGQPVSQMFGHLALQYPYGGSTMDIASQTTSDCVAKLLYNTGIASRFTLDMDSVVHLVDAIGGLAITVPDDPYYCAYTGYTPGQWVLLDGPAALQFVQYRDINVFGSCEMRIERQKVFVASFFHWFFECLTRHPLQIPRLCLSMKNDYCTDLSLSELLAIGCSALHMSATDISMQTLPGTIQNGSTYEEYWLDEPGTRQILLNLFYQPAA